MTNDTMLGGLYLLMAAMLVLGTLISRREPLAKMLVMVLAWIAIFGAGFVLFTFRDDLGYLAQRLKTEATGAPMIAGKELRIPQAIDGHFYVDGMLNGQQVRFLIDSGATMTTIGRADAERTGVSISANRNQLVQTGNGMVRVAQGRAETLNIGSIHRSDVGLHVSDDDLNVLGMNYLSTLQRWSVEGRWLVMVG